MSTLLEFSMTPLDKGESVGTYVARSLDVIDKSSLPYRLGPMGTCVEGEWNEVMAVVTRCFETMKKDCNRITVSLKIDYRKNGENRITTKMKSVEKHLERTLKK